ncbi:hypothetical protein KA531_00950 [Candidatus Saccharibacteria bacterium]|nr:hypothetical protein [Candidatus Saccharibacteria bacterium]
MTIKRVISNRPEDFKFQRSEKEGGGIYHLTPMTLETYYESVKPHLAGGADFTDQTSMISAFLTTKDNFW